MKISILHCRHFSDTCTSAACFQAYNASKKCFQRRKPIWVSVSIIIAQTFPIFWQ